MTKVILVDENDNEIGIEEKIRAHKDGKLHRAFSIFIFNNDSKLMLQKRAQSKYHSGGLWSNTACGHPRPSELTLEAAHRKLKEEMGFDCELKEAFHFIYKVDFENGLTEHEFDHVLVGYFNDAPKLNPSEASDWKWISADKLARSIKEHPQKYTHWLKKSFERVVLEE